jgi:glucose/arabinose dehydrogenase
MKKSQLPLCISILLVSSAGCQTTTKKKNTPIDSSKTATQILALPQPFATKSVANFSKVIYWSDTLKPIAPAGFTVTKFIGGLKSVRWIYVLPNGDILASQANTQTSGIKKITDAATGKSTSMHTSGSPNQITLLRDANKDGVPELTEVFLSGLNQPFGMLLIGNTFYVAVTDGLWAFPYKTGETKITATGKKIVDLPAGGYNNHWTRNIIANTKGSKIYISVGSGSNVAEHGMENEIRRANILEVNPDGTGERVYASGLRNPVGMAWAPISGELWTAVNERDEMGDDLVPDYLTSVKENGFYGWPYSYFGQHVDPRIGKKDQRPDLVTKTIIPDVPLGSHTASLGLAFYTHTRFPEKYKNGAFIGQHGSWNRNELVGYKVVFVPFKNGKPNGIPEDFLTGFIANKEKSEVYGRPVGVAVTAEGSLLVADDAADVIWRIAATK